MFLLKFLTLKKNNYNLKINFNSKAKNNLYFFEGLKKYFFSIIKIQPSIVMNLYKIKLYGNFLIKNQNQRLYKHEIKKLSIKPKKIFKKPIDKSFHLTYPKNFIFFLNNIFIKKIKSNIFSNLETHFKKNNQIFFKIGVFKFSKFNNKNYLNMLHFYEQFSENSILFSNLPKKLKYKAKINFFTIGLTTFKKIGKLIFFKALLNFKYFFYKIFSYKIFFYNPKRKTKKTSKKKKNSQTNLNFFIKLLLNKKDLMPNNFKDDKLNLLFLSNNFIVNNYNLFYLYNYKWENNNFLKNTLKKNLKVNNYYPLIFTNNKVYSIFLKKFKYSYNLNYLSFNNKIILNFMESFFKKKISVTISNNYFNKIHSPYLNKLLNSYKNFNPPYFKNNSISDFIEVLWYSFYMKDLNILSDWISKFMETLNFKNHKRFVVFFQNFINKNSGIFMSILSIKGFFFDIRGKVGVTGSSKKRHLFVKFGYLNKSSKNNKIDFNKNLVRSYSGVMGLTYIICY